MTLPNERKNSLILARRFLIDLVTGEYKRTPKEAKVAARSVLKHYPFDSQIDSISECDRCRKIIGNSWDEEFK